MNKNKIYYYTMSPTGEVLNIGSCLQDEWEYTKNIFEKSSRERN